MVSVFTKFVSKKRRVLEDLVSDLLVERGQKPGRKRDVLYHESVVFLTVHRSPESIIHELDMMLQGVESIPAYLNEAIRVVAGLSDVAIISSGTEVILDARVQEVLIFIARPDQIPVLRDTINFYLAGNPRVHRYSFNRAGRASVTRLLRGMYWYQQPAGYPKPVLFRV